jgi:hypothetical protein
VCNTGSPADIGLLEEFGELPVDDAAAIGFTRRFGPLLWNHYWRFTARSPRSQEKSAVSPVEREDRLIALNGRCHY